MIEEADIEAYYEKYGPMVYRRCLQLLKNKEKARDAMQDVFVQLMRKKETLEAEYPSSLLNTMATRICLNMIRAAKTKGEEEFDETLGNLAHYHEPDGAWAASRFLQKIFHKEKPDTRIIATLHFVDGLTLEEVAGEVGLSVSGVRKRLRLLKEKAQFTFGEDYER